MFGPTQGTACFASGDDLNKWGGEDGVGGGVFYIGTQHLCGY